MAREGFTQTQSMWARYGSLGSGVGEKLAQGLEARDIKTKDVLEKLQSKKALSLLFPNASEDELGALTPLSEKFRSELLAGGYGSQKREQPDEMIPRPEGANIPQSMMGQQQPQEEEYNPMEVFNMMPPQQRQMIETMPPAFQQELMKRMNEERKKERQQEMQREQQPIHEQGNAPGPQQPPQTAPAPRISAAEALNKARGKGIGEGASLDQKKFELSKEKFKLDQQKEARAQNANYTEPLEKRVGIISQVISKASNMMDLLEKTDDEGNAEVTSGWSGYWPTRSAGSSSELFGTDAQDVASLMTELQTGVQTISKMKWNESRKPQLTQTRETQIQKTQDLLDEGAKVELEGALRNYITDKNDNIEPKFIQKEVKKYYDRLENNIPERPGDAVDGEVFVDPKTKVQWKVKGRIMIFDGIVGE